MRFPSRLQTFHQIDEPNANFPLWIMVNSDRRWAAFFVGATSYFVFHHPRDESGAVGRLTDSPQVKPSASKAVIALPQIRYNSIRDNHLDNSRDFGSGKSPSVH